jgi:hypothetical protein
VVPKGRSRFCEEAMGRAKLLLLLAQEAYLVVQAADTALAGLLDQDHSPGDSGRLAAIQKAVDDKCRATDAYIAALRKYTDYLAAFEQNPRDEK